MAGYLQESSSKLALGNCCFKVLMSLVSLIVDSRIY